jgi:hypothetical protein
MTRLLLPLVCILALVAGGCGSDDGGGSEEDDPLAALDAAAKKTKAAESNRQQFKMEAEGGGEEVSFTGEATMSADSTRGHMTFEADGGQLSGSFEAITIDGVIYMKGDQLPIPEGKEWIKAQDPPTSTMSPSEFVQFLHDSGDVENEGTEEIRGQQTTHYSGPLDIRKIAEAEGSDLIKRLNQQPDAENLNFTVDIWVGEDGLPARMVAEIEPKQGEGHLTMTSDILEYNVEVDVEPPPASKVAG